MSSRDEIERNLIDAIRDPIALLDLNGTIVLTNAIAAQIMEDAGTLTGRHWSEVLPPAFIRPGHRALAITLRGKAARFTVEHLSAVATNRWWDISVTAARGGVGQITGFVVIARDITSEKSNEEKVHWLANHDDLTKLPNRLLLQGRLDELIQTASVNALPFGLLMIDVDDFKRINDTLGHDTGDALLRTFAERLTSATRNDDLVARLGGDEFAVILSGVSTVDELDAAICSIFAELKQPCIYDGKALDCQASIGASLYPAMGGAKAELIKNADLALYAAKEAGRGTRKIFHPSMRAEMQVRHSMLSLAKRAIEHELIVPHYQPKIDLRTGELVGFEALLRWRHAVHGIQTPHTISAAFQDPVLAADISDRMIASVIADIRVWLDTSVGFGHVAVNAAAAEFRRGSFAEGVLAQLACAAIPAECFQLEVTESVFLGRGAEHVSHALKTLSAAGVKIALDDFGTGFASLSHLKQFPVDTIKIDRSFVRDLHEDPEDEAIVRAVINLSKSLNIKVVAEGVETPAQSAYLRKYDCDYGQGFLFGAPIAAKDLPALVARMTARAKRLRANTGLALQVAEEQHLQSSVPISVATARCSCTNPSEPKITV